VAHRRCLRIRRTRRSRGCRRSDGGGNSCTPAATCVGALQVRIPCLRDDAAWAWVLEAEVAAQLRAAGLEAWGSAVVEDEALDRCAKELSVCLECSCDFQGPSVVR
jgi:hypothetical protein